MLMAAALAASATLRAEPMITELPPVPDAIGFAGAFVGVHAGHLLAGGGANFPDGVMPWKGGKKVWHDRLFALDLETKDAKWQEIGKLPVPNGYGVSITLPGGVLLIGGGDASRNFTSVLLLSCADGKSQFREFPSLPVPLAQMSGAKVGQAIHLCGGLEKPDATTASVAHWALDLTAPERGWQAQPPLPAAGRILACATGIGDGFFLIGGCSLAPDSNNKPVRTYLREAWKFADGKWTRLADPPRAAVAAASPAPIRGDSLFIVSGDDGSQAGLANPEEHRGFPRDVLRYDTASNSWAQAGALDIPPPVTLPAAPWKDGVILFNGEVKPGVRTPQVLHFTPP